MKIQQTQSNYNYNTSYHKTQTNFCGRFSVPVDAVQLSTKPKSLGMFDTIAKVLGIKKVINADELKKLQAEFKELFLRDDISIEETKNIINRYKTIDKIKDYNLYRTSFYDETKRNFGFGNIDLPLVIQEGQHSESGKTVGGAKMMMHEVILSPTIERKNLPKNIFHELRHIKQNYYSACLDHFKYIDMIIDKFRSKLPKETTEREINLAKLLIAKKMTDRWGSFTPDKIPVKDLDYAKKCFSAKKDYVSPHIDLKAYESNFLEQDAYSSEDKFNKVYNQIKNSEIIG